MKRMTEGEWQQWQRACLQSARAFGRSISTTEMEQLAERMGCIPPHYPPTPEEMTAQMLRNQQSTYHVRKKGKRKFFRS
ncbi:hypothetical protein DC3_28320 [Deinococcus cellulosilyticus NBRC 106333 = KACC 11606]|uniref:Uncharacterized protein n=1 Tax=Deinococcus cellulosilyticus (strain DSM 18568 / NBRC 106333 / KACC 11606 / 5516J-15) TaxID=1223518 RepID=A0A511N3X5_DEIC1|nr:hypothetical protein DC3_28320 [Deinococcus cellulosilyticus NBRC 106333 = KACC 11606]